MHGLLKYSYGILGLKCCILISDMFDGKMLLSCVSFILIIWYISYFIVSVFVMYLYIV